MIIDFNGEYYVDQSRSIAVLENPDEKFPTGVLDSNGEPIYRVRKRKLGFDLTSPKVRERHNGSCVKK